MLNETTNPSNGRAPLRHTATSSISASPRESGREEPYPQSTMRVKKRNGSSEPVDINKIVRAVNRCCIGLARVDALRVATKTISGLYDGATTRELDQLSIQTAAGLIFDEPEYAKLSARLLATYIEKEVRNQEIYAFSQSVAAGHRLGLVNDRLLSFVTANARKLNDAIAAARDAEFEYFGLRTVYDRYLLKHPKTRQVIETPQQFFLRIACALSETVPEALELYELFSSLEYLPSSPTLFNSGTRYEQLSSCFLLDSPSDHLEAIYSRYSDIAMLSKFSGGIGLAYHRVRSRGSLIESTNGHSNGIVPWLKTLDASVSAVNQGGKRKGACCVYLETWHADIEEFLELRDNTGDEASRTHNLNLANWVSDLFMARVQGDADWSLFDPKTVPDLPDLYGEDFERRYETLRAIYRTAWELPMRSLVDMAADRGAFIDQSQSLNLFIESPNIGQLSSMYFYAWKKGLKTTYYLRSRPATRIAKATVDTPASRSTSSPDGDPRAEEGWTPAPPAIAEKDVAAIACSLENPETCEACQ